MSIDQEDFDADQFLPGPHWNVKYRDQAANFQPTLPSDMSKIRENVRHNNPHLVYKELDTTSCGVKTMSKHEICMYCYSKFRIIVI